MPHINAMAKEGITMTDFYNTAAVSTPSRYGLLTGRYNFRSRLKMGILLPGDSTLIEKERQTIASSLRDAGYSTAAIGKWHLGFDWPIVDESKRPKNSTSLCTEMDFTQQIKGGPMSAGFDYFFGMDTPNFPPYAFIENGYIVGEIPTYIENNPSSGWPGLSQQNWNFQQVAPAIQSKVLAYIENNSHQEKPFFLYYSLTIPHTPIVPESRFKNKSAAGDYGDFVVQVDEYVGEIIAKLKALKIDDRTIVIFMSDNGPANIASGEKNTPGSFPGALKKLYDHDCAGGLRGMKGDLWEAGSRVPCIVYAPGLFPESYISNEIMSAADIFPTIASIAGARVKDAAAEDGYDMSGIWMKKESAKNVREAIVLHSSQGFFAIRQGDWKLLLHKSSGGGLSTVWKLDLYNSPFDGQLYNLKEDITEQNNLYDKYPDKVKHLTSLLESYKEKGRSNKR